MCKRVVHNELLQIQSAHTNNQWPPRSSNNGMKTYYPIKVVKRARGQFTHYLQQHGYLPNWLTYRIGRCWCFNKAALRDVTLGACSVTYPTANIHDHELLWINHYQQNSDINMNIFDTVRGLTYVWYLRNIEIQHNLPYLACRLCISVVYWSIAWLLTQYQPGQSPPPRFGTTHMSPRNHDGHCPWETFNQIFVLAAIVF